jgi:2-polyprenyl-6-methoxyphenol hydroxylase-like FAD-dependent oxidoreductase
MRRISIIGSGQASMTLGYALLQKGYNVTVFSDRTADQWLNDSRPTGTAYLFAETIDIERDLGIDHWSDTMHAGRGMHIHIANPDGNAPLVVSGRSVRPGAAVDQRMKIHRWMQGFADRGGNLCIEGVTPERVDDICTSSDLTVIAAGKSNIGNLIPRDAKRSVYTKPQRQLAMVLVRNVRGWADELGFTGVKFSALGPLGDIFWVPFTHKTAGESWSAIVEARRDSSLDVFTDCRSGEEIVDRLRDAIRIHAPWDYGSIVDMEYISEDAFGWLTGAFPPTVRMPFGELPSGRYVLPLGDTAVTFDPIGGQGGNNASHHAKFLANAIVRRKDLAFDKEWMVTTNTGFWDSRASFAYRFNNMFLEPPTAALQYLLLAASDDRNVADHLLVDNMANPKGFFPWIENLEDTRKAIQDLKATA